MVRADIRFNCGFQDYTSNEKHFLDIYEKKGREKGPDIATKASTVLLVDRTYTRHPNAKADSPPDVKTNEMAEVGEGLSLSVLIARFPQMPGEWEAGKFQRLEAHPTAGVSIERSHVIWGGWIKEGFGVDRSAEFRLEAGGCDGGFEQPFSQGFCGKSDAMGLRTSENDQTGES